MFSSSRRPPAKKVISAPGGTPGTSSSASTSTLTVPPIKRAAIRITTVRRTVEIKKLVVAPTIISERLEKSKLLGLKRKAEEEEKLRAGKIRKADSYSRREEKRERSISKSVRAVSSEESESESDKEVELESLGEITSTLSKIGPSVVERDVSASSEVEMEAVITGEKLVLDNRKSYVEYFVDISDGSRTTLEWAGAEIPAVNLEYPGINASERILLLLPKDAGEEYNPIEDVISIIRLTLDHFLTPAQSLATFSHSPSSNSFSAFLSEPPSRAGTPSTPSESTFSASTPPISTMPSLMRTLERAKSKKDGPAFLAAVERFNLSMRELKESGVIEDNIREMKGIKEVVWKMIVAQCYARAVGPEIEDLKNYEAFSDNVYGELLPKFMHEICQQTNLGPGKVFVDLGSGVGNCVVQAALSTGCESWGFENMPHAASLARTQVKEAEARFRMWGLNSGMMRTAEVDFCESQTVNEVLRRADVVLVNNEVFSSALNNRLSLLFLDLPSSALIVSLKAFASSFNLTAHNRYSPLAIIDQGKELRYGKKSVSWKDDGGTFWIARVDRTKLEKWEVKEEKRRQKEVEREKKEKERSEGLKEVLPAAMSAS